MWITARPFFAISYVIETLGVAALAIVVGWAVYRVFAGATNDPRVHHVHG